MTTADLVALLRVDLADPGGDRFPDEALRRCILKAVFPLARDWDLEMTESGGEIQPEPEGETRENLLLLARIHACQWMRAATANSFAFTSGDKQVDKTKQPEFWAKLEKDLRAEYQARLAAHQGGEGEGQSENGLLRPAGPIALIYEQGSAVET